jgi:hypothetical protein
MFSGRFWTSGYFLDTEDATASDLPWDEIDADREQSEALAACLRGFLVHSDTDSAYMPCFLRLPGEARTSSFAEALKEALGWSVTPEFERSELWGDIIVEPVARGEEALFWDPLEADEVDRCYDPLHLEALHRVTEEMQSDLRDLRRVRFPDAYVTYPVFWLGQSARDSWIGVWALRVDT